MLYLDYAKPLADGKYILSFFADSVADLESISHGQKFVTKNGTDYGVPQAGSTVIVTSPNSGKTTYVMDAEGIWVVTEDISYSAVVANPSDAATAKLEKLKVNDTTYANWTENEIKSIASESGGGKLYAHNITISEAFRLSFTVYRPTNKEIESIDEIVELANGHFIPAAYDDGDFAVFAQKVSTGIKVHGVGDNYIIINTIMQTVNITVRDTVTEL